MTCAISCRNVVRMRIWRSAVARQERERPSRVNRRNARAAWRMVDQSNRKRLLLSKFKHFSLSACCWRSIPLRLVLEHDKQKGDDGRDGKAIISECAQAVPSKVMEQEPYCEVPYEHRGNEACYEQQPFMRAHAGGYHLRKLQASGAGDDRN